MSQESPLVSIIIPCHNAALWLRSCLLSCFSQTYQEFEVILVDDCSQDESEAVAKEWEQEGLIYLKSDAGNASAARNCGLKAARGDWIQFLDADDILASDKIDRQIRLIQNHPGVKLVSGEWSRFQNHPREAKFKPEPNWRDLTGIEFLQFHFREGWMMQPGAWLTRRDLIDEAGFWDDSLSLNDDGEFFARVMLKAQNIRFCSGARVYYRSHSQFSLSHRKSKEAMDSLYRSCKLTFAHLLYVENTSTTRQAVADGWRWIASELFVNAPELSLQAEEQCEKFGGSRRPLPGGRLFKMLTPWVGWKKAKLAERNLHYLIH